MDNQTWHVFLSKAGCYIGQYKQMTVIGPEHQPAYLNGKQILLMNIADSGGLGASFAAWQRHDKEIPGRNQSIQGLEALSKQK
jgi:endothelin-converting enzyme